MIFYCLNPISESNTLKKYFPMLPYTLSALFNNWNEFVSEYINRMVAFYNKYRFLYILPIP
ncbi:hypothetical protein DYQ05_06575 [Treponema pedis]|nr:hypothetical protein DYQ05_06575 [Treponema pedis]